MLPINDLLILVILGYLLFKIIQIIIKSCRGKVHPSPHEDTTKATTASTETKKQTNIEKFQSLQKINNDLYLVFPGPSTEMVYRTSTLTESIKSLVENLADPIIKYLNQCEDCHFTLGTIVYVVAQEYQDGSIYTMEFVIMDHSHPVSAVIKMEVVINSQDLIHINYVKLVNDDGSSTNHLDHNLDKKPINTKDLKKTILPIPN